MTITGIPCLTHHINAGRAAGIRGYTGPCPYSPDTPAHIVGAWEVGRDETLEIEK